MSIQDYILDFGYFINGTIIPFLFALALLFFLVNIARYFIIDANDTGKREQARQFAVYGIATFVFLVSIWGIVNMLASSLGIDYDRSICPDYMGNWCRDSGDTYSGDPYFYFGAEYEENPFEQTPDRAPIPTQRNNYQLPTQGQNGGAY